MTNYKIHPLAETFPPFTDSEFEALVKDIGANGQREPITLFDGKVLDGVHRLKACRELNMEPRVRNYFGKDPLGYSVSENLKRRHLNESQRAVVAAQLANRNGGRSANRSQLGTVTNKDAATMLNVSEHSVDRAKTVLKNAPKEDVKAIQQGTKSVSAVVKEIKEAKTDKEIITDKFDRVVPEEMIEEWKRAEQVGKKLQTLAREIKSILSEGFAGPKQDRLKDNIYAEITNTAISDAQALGWYLSSVIPYALCPTCQGFNRKSCALCKKRGWISKFLYNSPAVSKETKAIIEGK